MFSFSKLPLAKVLIIVIDNILKYPKRCKETEGHKVGKISGKHMSREGEWERGEGGT